MKFLIKIEEAIDQLILTFIEKMKLATPHFVFDAIDWLKHSPQYTKHLIGICAPKVRIVISTFLGFFLSYITMIQGQVVSLLIYLKSDEFKNKNKVELVTTPLKKFKTDPIRAVSFLLIGAVVSFASYFIYLNTEKIIVGTKALRAPASMKELEEPIVEFKKLKYSVLDKDIFLDITIVATSIEERDKLIPIEKEIEEHLLGIQIHATQLPLTHEQIDAIEADITTQISGAKIKSVEVKQVLEARPKYFMQVEKLVSIKDMNLQLFLEDTKRNRQVWVDFTALSSNRNVILFLKDHNVEVRDYLNMNVEPVIPQLPIEEEGRQIIKDKIKLELNGFLKKYRVEGEILEIYLDYLIVS